MELNVIDVWREAWNQFCGAKSSMDFAEVVNVCDQALSQLNLRKQTHLESHVWIPRFEFLHAMASYAFTESYDRKATS